MRRANARCDFRIPSNTSPENPVIGQVRFGGFTLDLETRELHRGSECVALSPKAFRLLEILVEHHPKALSKATLQDRLWPDTVVVEKNLANLVAEIRHAVGDDAAEPRFVRTVHRFGYAFCGRLEEASADRGSATPARFALTWRGGGTDLLDGQYVLGRDPGLELAFDSPGVSRRHALLRVEGATVTVEDLQSKNGTFVGGRRVDARTTLVAGDSFSIGSVKLTLHVPPGQGPTETW
jgi:DNA-binding winged helix-turn-helix (wHTH) protein